MGMMDEQGDEHTKAGYNSVRLSSERPRLPACLPPPHGVVGGRNRSSDHSQGPQYQIDSNGE